MTRRRYGKEAVARRLKSKAKTSFIKFDDNKVDLKGVTDLRDATLQKATEEFFLKGKRVAAKRKAKASARKG